MLSMLPAHVRMPYLSSQQFLRPAVAEIPMIVYDKFKVHGQVELVFYQFVQLFGIHLVACHAVV